MSKFSYFIERLFKGRYWSDWYYFREYNPIGKFIFGLYYEPQYFFKRVYRVCQYLPVIWKDCNMDEISFWEITKRKLEIWADYLEKHGHCVSNEQDVKQIRICIMLLNRILKDDYPTFEYEKFSAWRENEIEAGRIKSSFLDSSYWTKEISDIVSRRRKHEEYMKKQDIEYLFKFLQKHIQTWWT